MNKFQLPVRDGVGVITYHRPPTKSEIKFGHACTHYRDFFVEECCWPGTRIMKRWFVAYDEKLRYYR